ncbi:MAG: M20/M25/M40 family metallo-hydrolase [Ruminococcaceae bacterium]|nr:M20/M25/M40 family metallo-hydrolase [Oscillospiraceae bacterium]
MKERIMELLAELSAVKSISRSAAERESAKWFADFFRAMPYFKAHPEYTGVYAIPGDPFGRTVPYALLRGKKPDTVVLSGHFDVVSAEEYGAAEAYAYQPGSAKLEELLRKMPLSERQRADLDSGEWLWGRGGADMKGGLAVHAALFEAYAKQAETDAPEGSLLFVPVPDEESYSAGMRSAVEIFKTLKQRYGLDYKLLIDPEPTRDVDGALTVSLGSVGKTMPTILVQGKKGHAGHCFEALSALDILADIYLRTNGSLEFSDVFADEATVPPTWTCLRDRKRGYDVSVPHRAYGYFTALSFDSTPEDIERRLKRICAEAFTEQVERLDRAYQQFKTMNRAERMEKISYEPCVMTFHELCAMLREQDAASFDAFLAEARERAVKQVNSGREDYPTATAALMEEVLDYSGIQYPITLLAFSPPYYPPVHADRVRGKEGYGSAAYRFLADFTQKEFDERVVYENYFMGISDLSYSAMTEPFDYASFSRDTPLWGEAYQINFEAMEYVAIPSIIYGPLGRDYHTYAERVNRRSLLQVVPAATKALVEHMWRL